MLGGAPASDTQLCCCELDPPNTSQEESLICGAFLVACPAVEHRSCPSVGTA